MKNSIQVGLFVICFVLFAGLSANAQSVLSQQQIQAKMEHNKSGDQKKMDALKTNSNGADDLSLNAKNETAMRAAGYLPIPGFVFTGNPTADIASYQAAKSALTPAQIADLMNRPASSDIKLVQDMGITTTPTEITAQPSGVTPQ